MTARWIASITAAVALAGCGLGSSPTGVATNPVVQSGKRTPTPSPTPAASGTRTVLSPLGLNIHSAPAINAQVLGTPAQGASLTVLDHTTQNGGWYKVQGQTVTGWITADPTLTAPGQFQQYQSTDFGFNALYPQDWTFSNSTTSVLFHPLTGQQSVVVRNGASLSALGPAGGTGYIRASQQTVVVCGVTGDLNTYTHIGAVAGTPTPGAAGGLPLLAQIRLRLDATHALAMDFNYAVDSDLGVFNAFYNSMTFPFPACMQSAPPTPTP